MTMLKQFYECIIYTFIRGYIHKGYNNNACTIHVKRSLDKYNKHIIYKILKHII